VVVLAELPLAAVLADDVVAVSSSFAALQEPTMTTNASAPNHADFLDIRCLSGSGDRAGLVFAKRDARVT
jgi:hypothetical protein